jgi:hypothetical protein
LHEEIDSIAGDLGTSLLSEFNAFLPPCPPVGASFVRDHFKRLFPRCSIMPHKDDYCDTCVKLRRVVISLENKIKGARGNGRGLLSDSAIILLRVKLLSAKRRVKDHKCLVSSERKETEECRGTSMNVGQAEWEFGIMEDLHYRMLRDPHTRARDTILVG